MIKALFLIFESEEAWNRLALLRRGAGYIVGLYLLPMMLIVGAVECFGLVKWGRWQSVMGQIKIFPVREALIYETAELLLMAVIILAAAHFIKALGDTFHVRNTYTETLTVVAYGLSPVFLFRLLDIFPAVNLWLPWAIGIMLTIKVLYHGVPRIMLPDPPDAFGLYFMSALLLAMVTALERLITNGCLGGSFHPAQNFVSELAARLPF
ncbi:MAG: YIP1 family protein [Verrucomicrobiota bacterium]